MLISNNKLLLYNFKQYLSKNKWETGYLFFLKMRDFLIFKKE